MRQAKHLTRHTTATTASLPRCSATYVLLMRQAGSTSTVTLFCAQRVCEQSFLSQFKCRRRRKTLNCAKSCTPAKCPTLQNKQINQSGQVFHICNSCRLKHRALSRCTANWTWKIRQVESLFNVSVQTHTLSNVITKCLQHTFYFSCSPANVFIPKSRQVSPQESAPFAKKAALPASQRRKKDKNRKSDCKWGGR